MDGLFNLDQLSLSGLLLNLLIGIVLSIAIALYYVRFGEALSNRPKFARLLPILCLITVFIISVIKGSLALSLGLVGALSIVRFRTAIKDPEELIFLFLVIALGIGLGADQRLATMMAVLVIMVVLVGIRLTAGRSQRKNLYLNIQVPEQTSGGELETVNGILTKHARLVDMRRLDRNDDTLQLTYLLDCKEQDTLVALIDDLRNDVPNSSFSFIDQSDIPA
ncbi:DUF4956 domain-containing protein [Chloroflexota bacterium]